MYSDAACVLSEAVCVGYRGVTVTVNPPRVSAVDETHVNTTAVVPAGPTGA